MLGDKDVSSQTCGGAIRQPKVGSDSARRESDDRDDLARYDELPGRSREKCWINAIHDRPRREGAYDIDDEQCVELAVEFRLAQGQILRSSAPANS